MTSSLSSSSSFSFLPPTGPMSAKPLASANAPMSVKPLASATAAMLAKPNTSVIARISAKPLALANVPMLAKPLASATAPTLATAPTSAKPLAPAAKRSSSRTKAPSAASSSSSSKWSSNLATTTTPSMDNASPAPSKWSPATSKWSPMTEWSPAPILGRSSSISALCFEPTCSGSSSRPSPSQTKSVVGVQASFEGRAKGQERFIVDQREAVSQDPHRWICSLMIFSFDETFVATGFLVKGLRTIFTTAHSLSGAEMVEIKFPGRPLISLALFNLKKDQCIWTDSAHDFAAIRLPSGSATSFKITDGVAVVPHAQLRTGDDVWVFGYPYPIPRQETLDKMKKNQQPQQQQQNGGGDSLSQWMMSLPRPSEYVRPSKRNNNNNNKDVVGKKGLQTQHPDDNHNSLRSPRDVSRIQQQLNRQPPPQSPFHRVSEDGLRLRRTMSRGGEFFFPSSDSHQQQQQQQRPNPTEPLPGEKIANLYDSHRKTASDWPILIGGRGRVKSNDGKTMKHLAETEGGDSGGPLLRRDADGCWRVVAIHLSCRKDGTYNSAALIDRKIIDNVDFLHSLQRETQEEEEGGRKGFNSGGGGGGLVAASSNIVAFQKSASEFLLP